MNKTQFLHGLQVLSLGPKTFYCLDGCSVLFSLSIPGPQTLLPGSLPRLSTSYPIRVMHCHHPQMPHLPVTFHRNCPLVTLGQLGHKDRAAPGPCHSELKIGIGCRSCRALHQVQTWGSFTQVPRGYQGRDHQAINQGQDPQRQGSTQPVLGLGGTQEPFLNTVSFAAHVPRAQVPGGGSLV